MRIYDTASRRKVDLITRTPGEVAIYNCGLTVQSPAHVGHARNALVFDVLRRYLRWRGYTVRYVYNVTDVDDKIIARAAAEGVSTDTLAARNIAALQADLTRLGAEPPDIMPRATEHIAEMIDLISILVERGHAYQAGGDVYFSVRSFPPYGTLSGRHLDDLRAGARVEPGEHKRDPLDFALWKGMKPGEPSWPSPWGPGRPGWHIECSAMSEKYLGRGFDIHGGGIDLVFPHHENEKAQSEAAHNDGVPFSRSWMHNGFVNLAGDKMSKSTGNLVLLSQLLDEQPKQAVRLLALQTHYRKDIDFGPEEVEEGGAAWRRLASARRRLVSASGVAEAKPLEPVAREQFIAAMDDDLNTAEALATVFGLVRTANHALDAGVDSGEAAAYLAELDELTGVLGLTFEAGEPPAALVLGVADLVRELGTPVEATEGLDNLVTIAVERRRQARVGKDWEAADMIRDRLADLGIVLADSGQETRWHWEDAGPRGT